MKIAFSIFIIIAALGIVTMAFKKNVHGKVVCFGDSITHGNYLNGHSWVYWLSEEHGNSAGFINEGRSGRKTSDTTELLPVLSKYPDASCYLVFLGVNDLKDGTDSMIDNCIGNMKWITAKIHAATPSARIVLLSPSGINLKTMNEVNVKKKYNANTQASLIKLESRYRALAKERKFGFISLLNTVSPENYTDGLHPNTEGQQQIAAAVWNGLQKLYK